MSIWDVDYGRLVRGLLPVRLRGARMGALLECLTAPVVFVYDLFRTNRDRNLYLLNHDGQVAYLQAVLNDVFDNSLRRIVVVDGVYLDPVFTYVRRELKPVLIYRRSEGLPVLLYRRVEMDGVFTDFIVQVPVGLSYDAVRMRAVVDLYRLPSKSSYAIVGV